MTVVVGCDPGLANFGLSLIEILPESERVISLTVIRTKKSDAKHEVYACDDAARRVSELSAQLEQYVPPDAVAVCSEAQSWPRNASAATKTAMAWGVLISLTQRRKLPLLQASPQQIKRALTGRKTASKDEIISAIECRYPEAPAWPEPRGVWEHAADSIGAVVACLDHPALILSRRWEF